jgi:sec-independent protein translocase protein TatA
MHFPGGVNLIVVMVLALLVFGPNKLPEIARSMGRAMSEFKNAMHEVTDHLDFSGTSAETRVYPGADRSLSAGGSVPGSPAAIASVDVPTIRPDYVESQPGGSANESLNVG